MRYTIAIYGLFILYYYPFVFLSLSLYYNTNVKLLSICPCFQKKFVNIQSLNRTKEVSYSSINCILTDWRACAKKVNPTYRC